MIIDGINFGNINGYDVIKKGKKLYLKIDKLRNNVDNIRMDDIKEIINHAIVKAEKRGSKRFFGGLKRKRSENGDVTILVEADFKD